MCGWVSEVVIGLWGGGQGVKELMSHEVQPSPVGGPVGGCHVLLGNAEVELAV